MTLQQFFRRARRNRHWHVQDGQVRCADGLCPLRASTVYLRDTRALQVAWLHRETAGWEHERVLYVLREGPSRHCG